MRHNVFGRKLNRDFKERKALFKSLIIALITFGSIRTTLAKAKAIYRLVDKLVSRAKDGSDAALKQVMAFLARKEAFNKLTKDVAPRFESKLGGYLRMKRVGKRKGDASEEVVLEWSVGDDKEKKEKKKNNIKQESKHEIGKNKVAPKETR